MGITSTACIFKFTETRYEERARVTIGHLDLSNKSGRFAASTLKRRAVKERDQTEQKHSLPAHCPPFHWALVPPPKNVNERLMTFKDSNTETRHML